MKKITILLATAALLAACSEEESVLPVSQTDSDAISFSAYTGETTKGVVEVNTEITKQDGTGIGVFAFYQPAVSGVKVDFNTRKFATPDFMYNQKVNCPTTKGTWEYEPVKFWPNNEGDQLSFFAYAPYESGTTWDDLGIATDATASKITASFPIYNEKLAMQDILWTDPQLNKTKASTATGATDNPIVFNFRHLLSKVAIYAGVEQNTATGLPTAWDDPNTTITIDKIEFTNLADAYNYSCAIPMSGVTTNCWTPSSTTQDIVLTYSNGDFAEASAVINNDNYNTAAFKDLLAKETVNSTDTDAFLFLAPQKFTDGNEQAIITYTVKTTASNSANSSTITNVIATDLYDILSGASNAFTTGKAYTLKFLLGMNSVKITASVTEWNEATEHQIDVPANLPRVNIVGNVPTTSYSEDDNNVYFTLANTLSCSGFEFKQSTTEDGTLSDVTTSVSESVVTIAKSNLATGTHYIKVTGDYTGATSDNAVVSSVSETSTSISIILNNTLALGSATFSESTDGSSYTASSATPTVSGSTITIAKSGLATGTHYIKVTGDYTGATSDNAVVDSVSETSTSISITLNNTLVLGSATFSESTDGSNYTTNSSVPTVSGSTITIAKSDLATGTHYIKVAADFSGAVTSKDKKYTTISNISETSDKVSFTVKTVSEDGQYFNKLEFGESTDGSKYTKNSKLTISGNLNANSSGVTIEKSKLSDETKYIQVTATKAIKLATCENCSASFSSETGNAFIFSISQKNDQQAYQSFSVYTSTDNGANWSSNVLQATAASGKCTKESNTITYTKETTPTVNAIKVKANKLISVQNDQYCTIGEVSQDAETCSFTVTSSKNNISVYAKSSSGNDYTLLVTGTGKGFYEKNSGTITYHKQDSEPYDIIKVYGY